jgi:hypothetical protein
MAITAIKDTTDFGTISYNGIAFGVFRENMQIRCEPVYDDADRSVKWLKYKLLIHTIIYSDDNTVGNTQGTMEGLQLALNEPGKTLTIQDVGFDTIHGVTSVTGDATRAQDIMWGVKPRVLEMRPVGGVLAWEVIWECEFNINRYSTSGFLAFNYDCVYDVDDEGLTTRVINGYAEVPGVLAGDGISALFNVDSQWDYITVGIPYGFQRVRNTHKINASKMRIDFTVIDRELSGEAFPTGIIKNDLTFSLQNAAERGFGAWVGSVSGSMTVAPGYQPSLAVPKFFAILYAKIGSMNALMANRPQPGAVVPITLAISHKLFSRETSFSCSFLISRCLEEVLQGTGMYDKNPDSDYNQWMASLSQVFSNRGVAGLRYQTAGDTIISRTNQRATVNIGYDAGGQLQPYGAGVYNVVCGTITEANSYLTYDVITRSLISTSQVLHKPASSTQGTGSGGAPSGSAPDPHTMQVQSDPTMWVIAYASAARLKFPVDTTASILTTVKGMQVEYWAELHSEQKKESFFGCALYKRKWIIVYRVKGIAEDMPVFSSGTDCDHDQNVFQKIEGAYSGT